MRKHLTYLNQKLTPRIKSGIVLGVAVLFFVATTIFAAPPGSQYNPAETLDPSCAPGDLNCSVDISSSGGDITIGDDVISGTANRVLFLDSAGNLDDSSDFLWNDGNKDFSVGDLAGSSNGLLLDIDNINRIISLGDLNQVTDGTRIDIESEDDIIAYVNSGFGGRFRVRDVVSGNSALAVTPGANGTLFTVNDDTQDIIAETNWFSVDDTLANGWLQVDTNNRQINIGDSASVGNDTLLTIDDANQNITLTNNPTAGYQFNLISDPALGTVIPGGAMAWSNTLTGESTRVTMGDFSGIGGNDVQASLSYVNLAQTNTSSFNVLSDRANMQYKSPTGGDSGTDTVDGNISLYDDQIYLHYSNSTQGLENEIGLSDDNVTLRYDVTGVAPRDIRLDTSGVTFDFNGDAYTFPVGDGSANQLLQTDGSGNLAWVDGATGDATGQKTTNYRLARELNISYKPESTQVVQIPEFDDPVATSAYEAGGSHGLIYIEQHDTLFSTVRNEPPGFIRFNDPDDLTNYDYVEITGQGNYSHPDQIVYSPYTDKVYMVLSNFYYGQPNANTLKVFEIDPVTLAYTLVINDNYPDLVGGPTITVVDNYLIAAQGYRTPEISKYDLDTYTEVDSVDITTIVDNAAHSLETDGDYLYVATSYPEHLYGLNSITKIDVATMSIVDTQEYSLGSSSRPVGGITDDILVWGNYIYAPVEAYDIGSNRILKINKDDLTDYVFLDVDLTATDFHSIFTDGRYIYYGGIGNTLGRFDPETNTGELYDASSFPGSDVNELATDGSRIFFAGFESYPVTGTGFVGRLAFFEGAIETYVLNADGTKLSTLDKVNSRLGVNDGAPDYALDVNYAGAGVVARFTSTDGNCTINPAVVGGIACSSDESLKKDIEPINGSQLDKLNQISPVEYHWKNDANEEKKTIGFIAQDVQTILPELVSLDPTTQKLTMSYAGLAVPLVGSVRELGLRLTSLEALNDLNLTGNTNKITQLFNDFLLTTQEIVINGLVKIKQATIDRLFAKRIATDTFCIDDMCITKDEFKTLLDNSDLTEQARDIFNGIEDEELDEVVEEGQNDNNDDANGEYSDTADSQQDSESQNDANNNLEDNSSSDIVETEDQTDDTVESQEKTAEEEVIENDTTSTSSSGGDIENQEESIEEAETGVDDEVVVEEETEIIIENEEENTTEESEEMVENREENTQAENTEEEGTGVSEEEPGGEEVAGEPETEEIVENTEELDDSIGSEFVEEPEPDSEPATSSEESTTE